MKAVNGSITKTLANGANGFQNADDLSNLFLDLSFDIIVVSSLGGDIIKANPSFYSEFKSNDADFESGNLSSVFLDQTKYNSILDQLKENESLKFQPVQLVRNDNKVISVLINAKIIDRFGRQLIIWLILDETAKEAYAETITKLTIKLENLNLQMENFLYRSSHDFRAPIASILGLVNLLGMENEEHLRTEYVDNIEKSALKLDKIVKDILIYSKAKYKKTTSVDIDIEKALNETIQSLSKEPNFNAVSIEMKVNQSYHFYSDQERLLLILQNIIGNALQYADLNKTISYLTIYAECTVEKVTITFTDNGIGIPKQYITNIFNMFYRAVDTSKGAGMGLFYVKQSLDQLKGVVSVQSELGFGTIFTISMPNGPKAWLKYQKEKFLKENKPVTQ